MSALGDDVSMHHKYLDAALHVVKNPLDGADEDIISASIDILDDVRNISQTLPFYSIYDIV